MNQAHLHIMPPSLNIAILEAPSPRPWWEAPELVALSELRLAIAGGSVPQLPPTNAEQSARQAVFWALFEIDHLVRQLGRRLEAGESLRMSSIIHRHQEGRVDFDLRLVEYPPIAAHLQPRRGAR
jgi:hypothetical protein